MDLLIDLGNSRMKWAWSAPGAWRTGAVDVEPGGPAAAGERVWTAAARPGRVVLCSVLDDDRTGGLIAWIGRRWSLAPHRVRAQAAQLGVTNGYREPAGLGSDRWAALIGARAICEDAVSVVDCGSAVTVDALSARGEFLGGVIFPGLRLLRGALQLGTAAVRTSGGDESSCIARTTSDGVAAGTLFGLCGAIGRVLEEQRQVLGEGATIVITGGDAPAVSARLPFVLTHAPELVLKGLARIAGTLP